MVCEERGADQERAGFDKSDFGFDGEAIKGKLDVEGVYFDFHSARQFGNNSFEKQKPPFRR